MRRYHHVILSAFYTPINVYLHFIFNFKIMFWNIPSWIKTHHNARYIDTSIPANGINTHTRHKVTAKDPLKYHGHLFRYSHSHNIQCIYHGRLIFIVGNPVLIRQHILYLYWYSPRDYTDPVHSVFHELWPGSIFTKRTNVILQNLVKSRSREFWV